jgi:hypothetical protein
MAGGSDAGTEIHGVTGQPQTYYGATPLQLESEGPPFKGGAVRLAVHLFTLTPPRAA